VACGIAWPDKGITGNIAMTIVFQFMIPPVWAFSNESGAEAFRRSCESFTG
jgi:hypothetical protein